MAEFVEKQILYSHKYWRPGFQSMKAAIANPVKSLRSE
jgi:hypothetical protein